MSTSNENLEETPTLDEQKADADENNTLPPVCSFRGIRKVVLQKVWKRARELEDQGIPLDTDQFGKMLKQEWAAAKAESRERCNIPAVRAAEKKIETEALELVK